MNHNTPLLFYSFSSSPGKPGTPCCPCSPFCPSIPGRPDGPCNPNTHIWNTDVIWNLKYINMFLSNGPKPNFWSEHFPLHCLQEIQELPCHPFALTLPGNLGYPGLPFLLWGRVCLAHQGVLVVLGILFVLNTHRNILTNGAWSAQQTDNMKWEFECSCRIPDSPGCPGSPLSPFGPSKETPGSPLSPVSPRGPGVPGSPLSPFVPGIPGWPGVPGRPGLPFSPEMKGLMDDVILGLYLPSFWWMDTNLWCRSCQIARENLDQVDLQKWQTGDVMQVLFE